MVDPGGSESGLARCWTPSGGVGNGAGAGSPTTGTAATAGTDPGSGAGAAGSGSAGADAAAGSGSAGAGAAIGSAGGAAIGSAGGGGGAGTETPGAGAGVQRSAGQGCSDRLGRGCSDWLGRGCGDRLGRRRRWKAGTETSVRPRRGAAEAERERPAGPAPTAHQPAARRPRQGPPRPPSIPSPRCQPSSMSPFPHIGPKSVYWMLQFDYRNCYTCGRCDQVVDNLGQSEHVLLRSISNRPQQGPTVV